MSNVRRAAVVLSALSALALTACGPAEDDAAAGTGTPTASPTTSASAAPSATAAPSKAAKPPASPSKGAPSDPDFNVFPCGTNDLKFTASLADPTTSSYLLKITNKGTKPCKALGHPVVTFGDLDGQATERGTAPGIEAALRLAPGQTAYAGLMGGAKDGKGKTVNWIAMTMNTESDLEQTPLKASTPGLYVSPDKNSVTPWVDNAEDALSL
ncbi:DUF4232 domain-containing protein [Streptomyces sp. NPDC091371]|uniref:DUF4232 domain-containing protein n=1 Tax=Streptomyces sp. NPDC091371 TaxID=3155303 RepID=UPI0034346E65